MITTRKQKLFITALALIAALGLTACSSQEPSNNNNTQQTGDAPVQTGSAFSSMETKDLEGNDVDGTVFADQKLTFVNTWNIGCTPCVEEIPFLNQLNEEYAEKGVAFKGLYYSMTPEIGDEEKAEIEKILSDAEADYQQLTISESMFEHEEISGIQAFPTTFVVNSDGEILDTILGSNTYDGWKETIEKYLAQVEDNE